MKGLNIALIVILLIFTIGAILLILHTQDCFLFGPAQLKTVRFIKNNFKPFEVEYKETYNNIPKVIVLTYKDKKQLEILRNKWEKMNPSFTVEIYDDDDCIKYLSNNFSPEHAKVFKNYIKDGPIKADYFRIHRMLEGGVYVDADTSIFDLKPYQDKFIIPRSMFRLQQNPTLIICPPYHKFISKCIEAYKKMWSKKVKYSYWGWSIVTIMTVLNQIATTKMPKILQEISPTGNRRIDPYKVYVKDLRTGKKIFTPRTKAYDAHSHEFKA